MDERQMQIRERAGLEESRLNLGFIEFLRRYSTPISVALIVIAGGWWAWNQYAKRQAENTDKAWAELDATTRVAAPSPDSLRAVADQHAGVGAVAELARLRAADVHLQAVRRGVRPGSTPQADGTFAATDKLSDEERATQLTLAEELFRAVEESTKDRAGREVIEVSALFGLAAVAEGRGNMGEAKSLYERIKSVAAGAKLSMHATIADKRIAGIDRLNTLPALLSETQLPAMPTPGAMGGGTSPAQPAGP
ncbi:MAG: hypothetical protein SFY95_12940, partial [Planctomycetota bacterium]|nr:hypothetical protein [Planctomycetota bacterium]